MRLRLFATFAQSPHTLTLSLTRRFGASTARSSKRPAAARMAAAMPEWTPPPAPADPVKARLPPLAVYNSLTRSKTPFVPLDEAGKTVTWYSCGITPYSDSHLGHARNYVSADVIRRIIQDYFHFDVKFVQNSTNVDDKIILAARRAHFLADHIKTHSTLDAQVFETTEAALRQYTTTQLPHLPEDVTPKSLAENIDKLYGHVLRGQALANDGSAPGDKEAKLKMHIRTVSAAADALVTPGTDSNSFYEKSAGVLMPYLDAQLSHSLDSSNHDIFNNYAQNFEDRFTEDMESLNVLPPDVLTRVTEYVPQIVDFVKRIEEHGFAYAHEGSVYFDIQAWEASGGVYARLEPWNRSNKDLMADGEGALSAQKTTFKKDPGDFALWKASKAGEPSWPSPWSSQGGRPGWHIECSAMASDILGSQFDIHSGGIDLCFPHHDNENAQSEAYWYASGKESKQWVNYFLHMGHLGIQGSKMSKSLKNFTTIREALAQGQSARGMRITFLLGHWKDSLEITDEVRKASIAWEEKLNNFFLKARDLERHPSEPRTDGVDPSLGPDGPLLEALKSAKFSLHDALCDSFDTPGAMRIISDLITAYNSETGVSDSTTFEIAKWISETVNIFGLDASPDPKRIGWSGIEIPEAAAPYVYPLAALRDEVRTQAIAGTINAEAIFTSFDTGALKTTPASQDAVPFAEAALEWLEKLNILIKDNAPAKSYLPLCDYCRDATLWNLGIYLEDRPNQPSLVRPLNASLREERANREALAALKLEKAKAAKETKDKEEKERLEKGKLDPKSMFKTEEFSEWDEDGLPVKDKEGKEVAKSRSKKLRKDWERQKKLHEGWLAAQK